MSSTGAPQLQSSESLVSTCVSAPGKLILTGEHSVVYGKVALAASLNLRTALRVKPTASSNAREPRALDSKHLKSGLGDSSGAQPQEMPVESLAVVAFWHLFTSIACASGSVPAVTVTVRSQLPIGAGLGSSAAYSVCVAAGLLEACQVIKRCPGATSCWNPADTRLINDWAFMAEKVIHGTPSGIDNSISTFGGALRFVKGQPSTQLHSVPQIRILLTNTKVPRSTKKLVAGVRQRKERFPTVMDPLLDSMEHVSSTMEDVLVKLSEDESQQKEGQWDPANTARLEELIDINQHLLNAIGVGHAALDTVCNVAASHGTHAKLTGAGGGGCAFVLLRKTMPASRVQSLCEALVARGFTASETAVGSQGVRVDKLIEELDTPAGEACASEGMVSPTTMGTVAWMALFMLPGVLSNG